jgi:hypothetical protein
LIVEILMALGTTFSMALNWRFAANMANIKLDVKNETDALRRELIGKIDVLSEKFVPGTIDAERRTSITSQVVKLETEINRNRERIHDQSNMMQKLMLDMSASNENMHNSLRDKAKRLTALEERERVAAEHMRDIDESIEQLERRISK